MEIVRLQNNRSGFTALRECVGHCGNAMVSQPRQINGLLLKETDEVT